MELVVFGIISFAVGSYWNERRQAPVQARLRHEALQNLRDIEAEMQNKRNRLRDIQDQIQRKQTRLNELIDVYPAEIGMLTPIDDCNPNVIYV